MGCCFSSENDSYDKEGRKKKDKRKKYCSLGEFGQDDYDFSDGHHHHGGNNNNDCNISGGGEHCIGGRDSGGGGDCEGGNDCGGGGGDD